MLGENIGIREIEGKAKLGYSHRASFLFATAIMGLRLFPFIPADIIISASSSKEIGNKRKFSRRREGKKQGE